MSEPKHIDFVDRSLRLKILGILQVGIGIIFALFIPLSITAISKQPSILKSENSLALKVMYPTVGFVLAIALGFLFIGIGSFFAKKWARALTLIWAWSLLFIGISSLATIPFEISLINEATAKAGSSGMMGTLFILFLAICLSIPYIFIPGMFVLLYRGEDVRKTCEFRTPSPSWVDGKPLSVIALVLMMAISALFFPIMIFSIGTFPVFGIFIKDPFKIFVTVTLISLISAYIGKLLYMLDIRGWVGALVWTLLFMLSALMFSSVDLLEYYQEIGINNYELELLKAQGKGNITPQWKAPLSMAPILLLVIYSRKYFQGKFFR